MSRAKKVDVEAEKTPEVVTPEAVAEQEVHDKEVKEVVYPEVGGNGKFQFVPFKGGCVVYNPAGQRCTGIVPPIEAENIVREQNSAARIKG